MSVYLPVGLSVCLSVGLGGCRPAVGWGGVGWSPLLVDLGRVGEEGKEGREGLESEDGIYLCDVCVLFGLGLG